MRIKGDVGCEIGIAHISPSLFVDGAFESLTTLLGFDDLTAPNTATNACQRSAIFGLGARIICTCKNNGRSID